MSNDQNADGVGTQEQTAAPRGLPALFTNKLVIAVVVAAVVCVAITLGIIFKKNRDAAQASRMLAVAQTTNQFEQVVQLYPDSAAAPVALLSIASMQFSAGAYDEALLRYIEFGDKYPKHDMLAVAELGRAMCAEAKGEIDKALMEFAAFLAGHADHYLTPQALFGKARCLQMTGKVSEAKIIYEDFLANHPDSKWSQQAEAAMQSLSRQMRAQQPAGNSPQAAK